MISTASSAPPAGVQWVATAYLLAMATAIPLTGWCVQRFGTKTMWVSVLSVFIAGSALCGLAWSIPSLVAFRVVQGLAGGMILPLAQTILAQAAGPRLLGRAMALVTGGPSGPKPVVFSEGCTGCGACLYACPERPRAIRLIPAATPR